MVKKFKPPLENLASVDKADCKYAAELTEIVGVVSFTGQAGWPATDDYEVHSFEFADWRRACQPLVRKELTLLRPVPPDSEYFSAYPAGSVHKVRVLLSVDERRAVFASLIKADVADAELLAVAAELQKPVVIETKRYGALTLNRQINWFEGAAVWNGVLIEMTFEPDAGIDIAAQLKTADVLFDDAAGWSKMVNDFAVKEKLELANDWRDEGDEPITADDFLKRMTLKSISITPDGHFDFWHDDGDLFAGHSIQISGSLKDGLTRSDIPG